MGSSVFSRSAVFGQQCITVLFVVAVCFYFAVAVTLVSRIRLTLICPG